MLYVYTLHHIFDDQPLEFIESFSQADARQDSEWQFSFPGRLSDQEIWYYCNENWNLPADEDGEIIDDYNDIPVKRVD